VRIAARSTSRKRDDGLPSSVQSLPSEGALGVLRAAARTPVIYGIGTVVFPFFVLQPSLGFGVASSRAPKPIQARLKSLASHTAFGIGLYLSALGVSYMLTAHA